VVANGRSLDANVDPASLKVTGLLVGGLAQAVGLQLGDRIVSVQGSQVADTAAIRTALVALGDHDTVEIVVERAGELRTCAGAAAGASLMGADAPVLGAPIRAKGLPRNRIVTLDAIPGCAISEIIGVVTELTSASGWTASSKGNQALTTALQGLARTATELGANAIVGLNAATFGAHGGLTSGFGGDAVGVLLTGTAVVVEDLSERDQLGA
jgi:uncharacterized protein YbjQ (UPF0145 family)